MVFDRFCILWNTLFNALRIGSLSEAIEFTKEEKSALEKWSRDIEITKKSYLLRFVRVLYKILYPQDRHRIGSCGLIELFVPHADGVQVENE